ncbi:MAG: hypothetical protein RJQ14_27095 [Marinoscillum sp.]
MADKIAHNCGITLLRLMKPLEYYADKYGSWTWGLQKLFLTTTKQINRGQDASGIGGLKLNTDQGERYLFRYRSTQANALMDIFSRIMKNISSIGKNNKEQSQDINWCKKNINSACEIYISHLAYRHTSTAMTIEQTEPTLFASDYKVKNTMVAGNYGIVNIEELVQFLSGKGFHLKSTDALHIVNKVFSYYIDYEYNEQLKRFRLESLNENEIADSISNNFNVEKVLLNVQNKIEGGYILTGFFGNGDSFVMRDPQGIRTAYYAHSDDFFVSASERSAIQSAFNLPYDDIFEIDPGSILIIDKNGNVKRSKP